MSVYSARHRSGRRLLALVAAGGLSSLALAAVPGVALAVGASTFESADGNLTFDGLAGKTNDWATVANSSAFHHTDDLPSGQTDNSFGQGSKDDQVNVTVVDGSIPNNKSDLTRFYEFQDKGTDGKQYLYLATERANTLGTANFSFELNQSPDQPDLTQPGAATLKRTAGDALILFDFAQGGKTATVSLARWVTSGSAKTACQASTSLPCWGKVAVISGGKNPLADGQVNQSTTPIHDPIANVDLAQFEFGELGINLTDTGLLAGCNGFAKAWVRSRASTAFGSELKDFIAPIDVNIQIAPDATGAHADSNDTTPHNLLPTGDGDGAVALHLTDPTLGDTSLPTHVTKSAQTGPGDSTDSANLTNVKLPSDGSVLTASVLNENTDSSVDARTATATQTTDAEVADLNVLQGTLKASVVKALSVTTASPNGASERSLFDFGQSGTVTIDADGPLGPGAPQAVAVSPGLHVPLSATFLGSGSYVDFLQEENHADHPPFGTVNKSGTYDAALRVTAIHVHITDRDPLTPGNQTLDLVVSKAFGLASHTGIVCTAPQEVSGNAAVVKASSPLLAPDPATVGYVHIAPTGGHDHATVAGAVLGPQATPLVSVGLANSDSYGAFDATKASSTSYADVANVCLAKAADGTCLVSAQAIHAQANASAVNGSRSADGNGTAYVGLVVAGMPIAVTPDPNTLQAVTGGVVVLNEQYCDDPAASLASGCTMGSSAGITVNAIHIVIPGVLDIIVGQAHADATFVPAA